MTQLTSLQAAKETGLSKSTITRAIKSGKLSATKDQDGVFKIDPAELFRVYPKPSENPPASSIRNDALRTEPQTQSAPGHDVERLTREIEIRDQRLDALAQERRREREDAQAQIDDLRQRLDAESQERRGLTRLLTDQQERKPKGFFSFLKRAG